MLIKINNTDFWTHLIGKYNASNLLAVYSVAMLLKLDSINVLSHLSKLKNVRGRFDIIKAKKAKIIIDYAHTPDALKNVLTSINEIRKDFKKLITIVGCGGDRDKKKRPLIGKIASIKSDKVIFTSDNPRNEDPEKIIESMNNGVPSECIKKVINVINREEAIRKAFSMLKSGDVLLIAGKGHEEFQEVKGCKKPFNEYKIVKKIISEIK
jgi:UDP-N-acetylmuramoyl-L-alanyl-D-glutamate--2,6-diaminopimelate ligase